MRHTLIPTQERLRIHHEYHLRLLIVSASVLSAVTLLGVAGLAPAYLSAWSADRAALSDLAFERGAKADSGLSDIENRLGADQKLLTVLASGPEAPKLSAAIRAVGSVQSSVEISTFNVSRQADSSIVMTVNGEAQTRDGLLSFKSRLEALSPGTTVDLPLSELAKSTDIPFSMRITQKNP